MKIGDRYKFIIAYFLEHAPEAETELISSGIEVSRRDYHGLNLTGKRL